MGPKVSRILVLIPILALGLAVYSLSAQDSRGGRDPFTGTWVEPWQIRDLPSNKLGSSAPGRRPETMGLTSLGTFQQVAVPIPQGERFGGARPKSPTQNPLPPLGPNAPIEGQRPIQAETAIPVTRNTTFEDLESTLIDIEPGDGGFTSLAGTLPSFTSVVIGGVTLRVRGHLYFNHETRQIKGISEVETPVPFPTLYGPVSVSGWSSFDKEGRLIFACPIGEDRSFTIGSYTIPYTRYGNQYVNKIFFHDTGTIADIHITQPQRLTVGSQAILFQHQEGCGGDLQFYKAGALRGGTLGEATTLDGVRYPRGTWIEFWPNGAIRTAIVPASSLSGTLTIKGVRLGYPGFGAAIRLSQTGEIDGVAGLAETTTLFGVRGQPGQMIQVYRYEDGTVNAYAYNTGEGRYFYLFDNKE